MSRAPRNIFEQQTANRRLTVLVMVAFTLLVALVGYGFDWFLLGTEIPLATFAALAAGIGSSAWSLQGGAQAVLRSSGARPVDESDDRYRQLRNIAEEMSIASGLPAPRLHVIPDHDPNAFATGKDPHHSHIVVTEGLLNTLNRDELQGVIAHEMAHIRNYDVRLMTVIAALIGAVVLLSEIGLRSVAMGSGKKKSSRGGGPVILIAWMVGLVLAPLASRMLALAVSRQREYLADASAAEFTRNPVALASALEKIDSSAEPTRSIKKGTAHLCIADPLARPVNSKEGFLADLMATHPPIRKRIMLLKAMAYQETITPEAP